MSVTLGHTSLPATPLVMDGRQTHDHSTNRDYRPYHVRVHEWVVACFGDKIASNLMERNARFLEEALELVQANGLTEDEVMQIFKYVYGRPIGELSQEVGGVMTTLASLCAAYGLHMENLSEAELKRVWTQVEVIREKQKTKPHFFPDATV